MHHIPIYTLLLLLLLSCFSGVRLCATPEMAAHQAPPSLGFSRQEHWSGLPFPSPIYTLLLLSHFSLVPLCATPETAAHQAPPSLGFSRQEHWSGLPFPSPIYTLGTLQSQTQFLIRAQGSSGIQGRLNGSLFVLKKPQTH